MIFTELLKALCARSGASGAAMIDRDGEMVASWTSGGLDMEFVGAHFEIILDAANEAAWGHGGPVSSLYISTDTSNIAALAIKEGYCLIVVLGRSSHQLEVMREASRAISEIEAEMG